MKPNPPVRLVSQPLVVAWAAWILISWLFNLSFDMTSRSVDVDSTLPAVQRTLESILVGLGIVWPVWRLSMPTAAPNGWRTVVDALTMLLMLQVVIYPLSVLVQWSTPQTIYIDLTLIVWAGAFALAVWDKAPAASYRRSTTRRAVAMMACFGLITAGPIFAAITGYLPAAQWSPATLLWHLADPNPQHIIHPMQLSIQLCILALAELAYWVWVISNRPTTTPDTTTPDTTTPETTTPETPSTPESTSPPTAPTDLSPPPKS